MTIDTHDFLVVAVEFVLAVLAVVHNAGVVVLVLASMLYKPFFFVSDARGK